MKNYSFLLACMLFSMTVFANAPHQKQINLPQSKVNNPGTCTISMTVSVTFGMSYIGVVNGSGTASVTGTWSGDCSELLTAGKTLYSRLRAMLPRAYEAEPIDPNVDAEDLAEEVPSIEIN